MLFAVIKPRADNLHVYAAEYIVDRTENKRDFRRINWRKKWETFTSFKYMYIFIFRHQVFRFFLWYAWANRTRRDWGARKTRDERNKIYIKREENFSIVFCSISGYAHICMHTMCLSPSSSLRLWDFFFVWDFNSFFSANIFSSQFDDVCLYIQEQ